MTTPTTRRTSRHLLAIAGLILFGQGAYIHAKALLAQLLLERAFDAAIATGQWQSHGHGLTPGRSRASRSNASAPAPSCSPAAADRRWRSVRAMSN